MSEDEGEGDTRDAMSKSTAKSGRLPSRCGTGGGGSVKTAGGSVSGSTVLSVKSLRRPEVIAELPVLSDEQKLRAMLGFRDEDANKVVIEEIL
jgi:hypothetical protein